MALYVVKRIICNQMKSYEIKWNRIVCGTIFQLVIIPSYAINYFILLYELQGYWRSEYRCMRCLRTTYVNEVTTIINWGTIRGRNFPLRVHIQRSRLTENIGIYNSHGLYLLLRRHSRQDANRRALYFIVNRILLKQLNYGNI